MTEKIIKDLFYSPSQGLIGTNKIYEKLKEDYPEIKYDEIKDILNKQEASQLFQRRKTLKNYFPLRANTPSQRIQIDLMDFSNQSPTLNKGMKWIFCAVDVYSRYAWTIALKSKETSECVRALKYLMKNIIMTPNQIDSDGEKGFESKFFQKILEDNDIIHNVSKPHDLQSKGIVERFNQTLRRMVELYKAQYDTKVWTDVLDDITNSYNDSIHFGMKNSPNEVYHSLNTVGGDEILKQRDKEFEMKADKASKDISSKLKKGDSVRKLLHRHLLEKKTKQIWSKKVYKISKVDNGYFYIDDDPDYYRYQDLLKIVNPEVNSAKREAPDTFDREIFLKDTLPKMKQDKNVITKEFPKTALQERKENKPKRNVKKIYEFFDKKAKQ